MNASIFFPALELVFSNMYFSHSSVNRFVRFQQQVFGRVCVRKDSRLVLIQLACVEMPCPV